MNLVEFYKNSDISANSGNDDFILLPYNHDCYVGFDSSGNLCVVILSSSKSTSIIRQKTKLLSVECNTQLKFRIDGNNGDNIVHILRCFSIVEKERLFFLELVDAMLQKKTTDEEILDTFRTLVKFFADKSEPSDIELIGLYAELDAICSFPELKLAEYWQSKERLKFDFSFSDKLKLEIKATTKNFRIHHFKHEQLATDIYNIIILSYLFRFDDEGLSLYELILKTKPYLSGNVLKLTRVNSILKNVSEERLKSIKFSPEYTKEKRHFYNASDIPHFIEQVPDGIANAEYDCNLENLQFIPDNKCISLITETISIGDQ